MQKTIKNYRIEMRANEEIIKGIVMLAALSNGGQYLGLDVLEAYAKASYVPYPILGKDVTIHRIGNVLTIDKGTENHLVITEVEIMEIAPPQLSSQEAKDILDEIAPSLNRYSGTGIDNPENFENLN